MKLAILETGVPPEPLADEFGSYPDMFARLLGPGFEIETFDVEKGEIPERGAHGAYLVTGSPAYLAKASAQRISLPQYGLEWSEGQNAIQADYRMTHAVAR